MTWQNLSDLVCIQICDPTNLEQPIAMSIQTRKMRHAPFGELRVEKVINSDYVRHCCVVCCNVSIRGPNGGKNCAAHYFQGGYRVEIWLQKKLSRFIRSVILRSSNISVLVPKLIQNTFTTACTIILKFCCLFFYYLDCIQSRLLRIIGVLLYKIGSVIFFI